VRPGEAPEPFVETPKRPPEPERYPAPHEEPAPPKVPIHPERITILPEPPEQGTPPGEGGGTAPAHKTRMPRLRKKG
jgi:hypothetical protein